MADSDTYKRWQPAEWLRVGAHALRYLDKGREPLDAVLMAQKKALPKSRHKTPEEFNASAQNMRTALAKYAGLARALTPEAFAQLVPPDEARGAAGRQAANAAEPTVPSEPKVKSEDPPGVRRNSLGRIIGKRGKYPRPVYKGTKRWTQREWALIGRYVEWARAQGDTRTLSRLVIEGQEQVLAEDRRRSLQSLQQAKMDGHLEGNVTEGMRNAWTVKDVPFAFDGSAKPDVPSVPSTESAQPGELSEPTEPSAQPSTKSEPSSPSARTVFEFSEQQGHQTGAIGAAAREFGETVMAALDRLLRTHTEVLMASVYERISENARDSAASIAHMIEKSMQATVHKLIEHELGPTHGEPAAPASSFQQPPDEAPTPGVASQAQAPEEPQPRQRLRIDVIGVEGSYVVAVREALNGHSAELNFVSDDKLARWQPTPGREVVAVTTRIPHGVTMKLRAARVEPVFVRGGPNNVVRAIEQIARLRRTLELEPA